MEEEQTPRHVRGGGEAELPGTCLSVQRACLTRRPVPGQVDKAVLAKCLLQICHLVKDILTQEPRLLHLNSPCYILGTPSDHGMHSTAT